MVDFSIFLIHGVQGRADDVIRVRPLMDRFRITYTSRHSNVNHFMYYTKEETYRYIDDLMRLLPFDAEPFTSIQFNFPCFPVLLYRVDALHNQHVRYTIIDRMVALLDNWPESRPLENALPTAPTVPNAVPSAAAPMIISLQDLLSAYSQESA